MRLHDNTNRRNRVRQPLADFGTGSGARIGPETVVAAGGSSRAAARRASRAARHAEESDPARPSAARFPWPFAHPAPNPAASFSLSSELDDRPKALFGTSEMFRARRTSDADPQGPLHGVCRRDGKCPEETYLPSEKTRYHSGATGHARGGCVGMVVPERISPSCIRHPPCSGAARSLETRPCPSAM